MATWPATLPSALDIGLQETRQQAFIRSATDTGPFKQRGRFTAASRFLRGTMLVNATQKAAFDTFYEMTLAQGAEAFDWDDPNDLSTVSMRFVEPPSAQALIGGASGAALWRVSLSLEVLP